MDLGVEAIRRIGESPLPNNQKALLGDRVETHIERPEVELERFRGILTANETGRMKPVNQTRVQLAHEKKGEERKGIGIEDGRIRTLRAAVPERLEAKCGPAAGDISACMAAETDPTVLRAALVAAGTAVSLDAFRTAVPW